MATNKRASDRGDTCTKNYFVTIRDDSFGNVDLGLHSPIKDVMDWFSEQEKIIQSEFDTILPNNLPQWGAVVQFGSLGEHLHIHAILVFEKSIRLSKLEPMFNSYFSDVVIEKVGNIKTLLTYCMAEVGGVIAKSFMGVARTSTPDSTMDTNDGEDDGADPASGKMTFRKLCVMKIRQAGENFNAKKLKYELMKNYTHMFNAAQFDEIVHLHRQLAQGNINEEVQDRCTYQHFLTLMHWIDLQNECEDKNPLVSCFSNYTRPRTKEDKSTLVLFGETGIGKTWCLEWLKVLNTSLINMTVDGSGKFHALLNSDVVILEEMPQNMKLWQNPRGGSATVLQLLHGDSTTVKVPGYLSQVEQPPWAVVTTNYYEENGLSKELKRRLMVAYLVDLNKCLLHTGRDEYPYNYGNGPFPFCTYNNQHVYNYFKRCREQLEINNEYPCFCVRFDDTEACYTCPSWHQLCKNPCQGLD